MSDFDQFLEAAKQHMPTEGRAQHVTVNFQQLFAVLPAGVTLADLAAGWRALARPHSQQEEKFVAHRRQMCAQMASIAAPLISEPGNLTGAVRAWQAWLDAFQGSADHRLAKMAEAFARELVELQSALPDPLPDASR